ncbi:MAG: AAA family ATPase [Chlamydiota bacterium]
MKKLPIGISGFPELRKTNCVYVDKTKHVYSLLTNNRRTFLARPRRFGKSLLVTTLEAALQGKKELFDGLWIANSDYSFEPKGVIRLDFSQLSIESIETFKQSLFFMLKTIAKQHEIKINDNLNVNSALSLIITSLCETNLKTRLTNLVSCFFKNRLKKKSFKSVAILIDEYDAPILHTLHNPELAKAIREIMKNFSCVIKGQETLVQFVFVTGVSAFSKSGLSSGLNNLKNLTMNEDFFDVCGYTDEEVDLNFKEHIENWANLRQIPYEEVRGQLKSWYNGYCFIESTPTIYSPFSLSNALDIKKLQNFWFESATPQVLIDELRKDSRANECRLLELDQLRGTGDLLQTFEIESLPLPALLFQMGYLTINSYDPLSRNYQLKYPNMEVRASFLRHIVALVTHKATARINPLIGDIYRILVEEKPDELVFVLTTILSGIPYSLHIEDEKFYHSLLQTIFFAAGIEAQSERLTSIGRMDIILELPTILYIVELKMNKPSEEGLDQIESRKYYEPFMHKNKPIRALAISFLRVKSSNTENSDFVITCALRVIK